MTDLANPITGEVVVDLTEDEARSLTDSIKGDLSDVWEKITEAYTGRAWHALYYESWDQYCREEFGASRLRLPSEERREVVGSLRDAGLSIRAIAAATGSARNTVKADLRQVGQSDPPEVEPRFKKSQQKITGTDGKSYEKRTERTSTSVTTEKFPPTTAGKEGAGSPESAPASSDAERINGAFANGVDPVLEYRAKFSKKLDAAFQIVSADIDRAAQSCEGPERARVKRIREWCDQYLDATKSNHLRSV